MQNLSRAAESSLALAIKSLVHKITVGFLSRTVSYGVCFSKARLSSLVSVYREKEDDASRRCGYVFE